MLQEVRIRNLAIIKDLTAHFDSGLHVITGETGAGKSILLHALGLMSGARASRSMIRKGATSLYVEGVFSPQEKDLLPLLSPYGVEPGEPLVLSRTVQSSGKSAARIQGQLVTVTELKAIGDRLLDVYGQKDRALLDQDQQLRLLDSFLEEEDLEVLQNYRARYQKRKQKMDFLARYGTDPNQREREMDILQYQIQEIEAFDPYETDLDALETEHRKLLHAEELTQLAEQIDRLLGGWSDEQPGALMLLEKSEHLALKMEGLAPSLGVSERLTEVLELLRDAQREFSRATSDLQMDPQRLGQLDQTMSEWLRLQRKYGQTKEEVLAFLEQSRREMETIREREASLVQAEKEIASLTEELGQLADRLTRARKAIGERIDRQIVSVLQGLLMEHVAFETRFTEVPLQESGQDRIVFHIRTNQGQRMQPLHEIASGGELSRVMLAIRSLFVSEFASSTVVFDEIDTGVSGKAAQAMAEFLRTLSEKMQVIAVTHLPQIASMGDAHSLIEKETREEETISKLSLLDEQPRIDEVARLISGSTKTHSAAVQAEQLLRQAAQWKQGGENGKHREDN